MKKIINQLGPILILLGLGIVMLSGHLKKPFYGHHDFNSVYFSTMARNYLRYGLVTTKLGQVTNSGIVLPQEFNWHTHFPSLFPLLLAFNYRILGESEVAGRLLPLSFSLLSVLFLYAISQELKLSRLAGLATGLILFTPMLRYFGSLPVHEPLVVAVSLASVWFYLKRQFKLLYLTALINGFLSWPGYFLYPLLSFHALVSNRKYFKKTLLALVILLTTLSLHFGHVYILTGNPLGGGLLKALMFRLNLMPQNGGPDLVGFTLKKLIIQEARWITVYYTKLVVFFGLATAGVIGWKMIFLKKFDRLSSVLLLLLSFGLSYQLVLPNIVFIHDYFNIYFYPYFALSLSFWIEKIVSRSSQIAIVFLVALSLLIYRERTEFFRALENSNMHQTGFTLGKLIAEVVPPGENAVVFSINYADHHGVFINYYADRQISFQGYGLDGWADFLQISSDTLNAFTVIDHRLDNGVIDKALATQAASMSNFGNFNFYRLNQGAKIN